MGKITIMCHLVKEKLCSILFWGEISSYVFSECLWKSFKESVNESGEGDMRLLCWQPRFQLALFIIYFLHFIPLFSAATIRIYFFSTFVVLQRSFLTVCSLKEAEWPLGLCWQVKGGGEEAPTHCPLTTKCKCGADAVHLLGTTVTLTAASPAVVLDHLPKKPAAGSTEPPLQ